MARAIVEDRGVETAATAAIDYRAPSVSWGAVIGGAFLIAALGIILLALGAGFGLSTVSPWPGGGVAATTFTATTAIWLIVVQWLSCAFGGYVTGRLCPLWRRLHVHEAHFRDTAHGILAWAVAAVVTAALLASAVSSILGGAARGSTTMAAAAAPAAMSGGAGGGPDLYLVDRLFRSDKPDAAASGAQVRAEAERILVADIGSSHMQADRAYLTELVAARTGISTADAGKRIDAMVTEARHDADATRKAAALLALYTGFSLLVGAFISGVAAKIGGNHRDRLAI